MLKIVYKFFPSDFLFVSCQLMLDFIDKSAQRDQFIDIDNLNDFNI